MKAYVVQSQKVIEPFGNHPRDCLITNRKLGDLQYEVLQAQGFDPETVLREAEIVDSGEHLVLGDNVYFTPELLAEFLARSRARHTPSVCALKPGLATLRTVVATQNVATYPDRIEYDLRYSPGGQSGAGQASIAPIVIEPDRFTESAHFPSHIAGSDGYLVPLTEKGIIQIDHWANLWSANICAILANLARLKMAPLYRLLGLALRARSLNQWKVIQQATKVGKHCDIHPTAYVEASTIGNGVTIGARAVVRESVIGDGAYVGVNATVDTSVVGGGSAVLNGSNVMFCLLYPGTCVATRLVSLSMTGYDTEIASGVVLTDYRFDGKDIEVLKDGVRIDTRSTLLGSCLGHGVYLGAGVSLAPGRAVPNGWRIVPDKSRVLESCRSEESLGGYRLLRKTESPSTSAPI